jgi:predicted RNase H-like nuclease (RuvC/YqgF family)
MNESEQIERLESEIRNLEHECEMWRKTSNQLTETLNKLINAFIFKTDKA